MSGWWGLARRTGRSFVEDRCPRLAAALAFYTFFSLPPLLMLVTMLTDLIVPSARAEARILAELAALVGAEAASQVQAMIHEARSASGGGLVPGAVGAVAVAFGATRAFAVLQEALNIVWGIPAHRGVQYFVGKRLVSFAMILVLALMFLISLVLSAVTRAAGGVVGRWLPGEIPLGVIELAPTALDLVLLPVFFATLFVFLPDVRIPWRVVWFGAVITALCFVLGKLGIGLYLARVDPGSVYGAAGVLAVLLLWVYYCAMAVLLGAELTRAWADGGDRSGGPPGVERSPSHEGRPGDVSSRPAGRTDGDSPR